MDDTGGLWAGLDPGGLNRVRRQLLHPLDASANLTVHSAAEDAQGRLWFSSTSQGVNYWKDDVLGNTDDGHLSHQPIRCPRVLVDRAQTIWAATFSDGLFRWDGNQFLPAPANDQINPQHLRPASGSHHGRLWAGTLRGLACWDGQSWRIFHDQRTV